MPNLAYGLISGPFSTPNGTGLESVTNPVAGSYLVNYSTVYSQPPAVVATPWGTGLLCSLNIFAVNMCEVWVTDLQGNPVNGGFSFLAIGD